MFKFETIIRPGREAERLTTAFYRFLEVQNASDVDGASVQTEVIGEREKRTIFLWSEESVDAFERFLAAFKMEPPRGLLPPFGRRRTEG